MSIQNTVDSLRRQSLSEVLRNVDVPSTYILSKLNKYISVGSSTAFSFPSLVDIDKYRPTFADINAKSLFSYLDIFTSYVLCYTSTNLFNSLATLTSSKYEYVIRKYKEAMVLFKSKELEKENKYNLYIDFSVPSNIYKESFYNNIFDTFNISSLSFKDVLSLPVISTETIFPDETSAHVEDSTLSKIEQVKSRDFVFCKLFRVTGDKIGKVFGDNSLRKWGSKNDIGPFPYISGSTMGYVCDEFFLQITNKEGSNVFFKTSIDKVSWSEEFVTTDIYSDTAIFLPDVIDTGLKFRFYENHIANIGDTWTVRITYVTTNDPECKIRVVFNSIYNISFLKFNDLSLYKLIISSNPLIKYEETSDYSTDISLSNGDIVKILPINNTMYSIEFSIKQPKNRISDLDGKLSYVYDFNLSDISSIKNKYSNYGVSLFSPLSVSDISTISVSSETFVFRYKNGNNYYLDKSYILFSVVCETEFGICEIPILPDDFYTKFSDLYDSVNDKYYITEPVLALSAISDFNEKRYKLKYPYTGLEEDHLMLYDMNDQGNPDLSSIRGSSSIHETYIGYQTGVNKYYTLKYPIKVNSQHDTLLSVILQDGDTTSKWTAVNSAKIAYMLYLDTDNRLQMAIRSISKLDKTNNSLIPFTGSIYGKVTMSSFDLDYVSPYVYNYSISCS